MLNHRFSLALLSLLASVATLGACSDSEPLQVLPTVGSGGSDTGTGGAAAGTGGTVTATGGSQTEGCDDCDHPSEPHVAEDVCTDTAASNFSVSEQYGVAEVQVNGGAKSYILATNWWSSYNGQTVSGTGNNFLISGAAGEANRNIGAPAGFPTLYLGSYNGRVSQGNPLPKQVSELNAVPTEFRTNGTQFDQAYYNAAYDVWFTRDAAGVPDQQYDPGVGGAYLMVWTFDPTEKRPRGPNNPQFPSRKIEGVTGTWDVWVDDTDPPCISYVATEPVDDLGFDLKHFIDDSVENAYGITNDMYLSIVFAGFEVWADGDGLQADEFCVEVQ